VRRSVVHHTEASPAAASELTYVLLGLLSCGRSLETLAARAVAPQRLAPSPAPAARPPDTLMALVLGGLSAGRHLRARLEGLLGEAPRPRPAPPARPGGLRDLLR
jgi:hypothetical protein